MDKKVPRIGAEGRVRPKLLAMTDAENQALDAVTQAAHLTLTLPEEHPSERMEMAAAFHVIQNHIAARHVWREVNK